MPGADIAPPRGGVTVSDAVRASLARRRQPTPQARDVWLVLQHLGVWA